MATTKQASVPLSMLRRDADYQPRGNGLDADNLERLLASDPDTWPPILVTPNGEGYTVLDGAHRVEAATRLRLPALRCDVVQDGGYHDAVEANLRHGLPLSKEDRKEYARWLHEQEAHLSYRELGRRCGLDHKTVKAALESRGDVPHDGRKAAPNAAARLVKQLLDVRDAAANNWGVKTHSARVAAFREAIDRQENPRKAAQRLADTCRAALEAVEGVAHTAKP